MEHALGMGTGRQTSVGSLAGLPASHPVSCRHQAGHRPARDVNKHPRRESNSHLRIRNPLFYPLNYEGLFKAGGPLMDRTPSKQVPLSSRSRIHGASESAVSRRQAWLASQT